MYAIIHKIREICVIVHKMLRISELDYKFRRLNLLLVGVKYQN